MNVTKDDYVSWCKIVPCLVHSMYTYFLFGIQRKKTPWAPIAFGYSLSFFHETGQCRDKLQVELPRICFYQTRSAWSRDQGSNKNHSPAYNVAPTVTKFCVMGEGLSLPHDTKFGNCRCKIVDSRVFPIWSLIHGSTWSGLILGLSERLDEGTKTRCCLISYNLDVNLNLQRSYFLFHYIIRFDVRMLEYLVKIFLYMYIMEVNNCVSD